MGFRQTDSLLKIVFVLIVCLLLASLSYMASDSSKAYLNKDATTLALNQLYAKIQWPKLQIRQNGEFWILENYILARRQFSDLESITYTTHGEYTFLDNLEEVVERWRAPISIAIFAPGSDFDKTLHSIEYLRGCTNEKRLIQEFITFHIYFPAAHMPLFVPKTAEDFKSFAPNCSESPPFVAENDKTYRHNNSILYPINVGRNIARRTARTHFVFPCDIEMYPNRNFVKDFLSLIRREPQLLIGTQRVYAMAVFEVEKCQEIPNNKTDLQEMLHSREAIPLHICKVSHAIPGLNDWISQIENKALGIFSVIKHRPGWEPFYVTTNFEPFFDERYTLEAHYDKRIQAHLLGWMNYDFNILDKAFLIHRPGIEMKSKHSSEVVKMKKRTQYEIAPQLKRLYIWTESDLNYERCNTIDTREVLLEVK